MADFHLAAPRSPLQTTLIPAPGVRDGHNNGKSDEKHPSPPPGQEDFLQSDGLLSFLQKFSLHLNLSFTLQSVPYTTACPSHHSLLLPPKFPRYHSLFPASQFVPHAATLPSSRCSLLLPSP